MPAIFRTPAIGQMRQGIGDVVIRRGKAADIGAACKQLGVNVQKFRIGIAGLELKAMAHALRSFNYKGIIVGTDAVRAVIEARIEAVGPDRIQRTIIADSIYPIIILKHGQVPAEGSLVFGAKE